MPEQIEEHQNHSLPWKKIFFYGSWSFLTIILILSGIQIFQIGRTENVAMGSYGSSVPKLETASNNLDSNTNISTPEEQSISNSSLENESSSKENKTSRRLRASTWFSDYEAMKKVVHLYDEIHPFIYSMRGGLSNNGDIICSWGKDNRKSRIAELRSLNPKVKIIPTIFRWENPKEKISENIGMGGNTSIRDKHIQTIVNEVLVNDYDGIDIDYEGMSCEKKEKFEEFIVLLSKELKSHNKLLSIAVHPKTPLEKPKQVSCKGKKTIQDFRENWRGPTTHDYAFLAKYADRIKIMAYELHPRKYHNPGPGPQAPNVWLRDIIEYAQTRVPAEKLYMAIPTYGYDWALNCKSRAKAVYWSDALEIQAGAHKKYQPSDVNSILTKEDPNNTWRNLRRFSFVHENKNYEDPSLWYRSGGCDRVAFFMNRKAFEEKMNLLRGSDVGGFSFWQLLSDNDPGINDYLELLQTDKLPPVPKMAKLEKLVKVSEEKNLQNSNLEGNKTLQDSKKNLSNKNSSKTKKNGSKNLLKGKNPKNSESGIQVTPSPIPEDTKELAPTN